MHWVRSLSTVRVNVGRKTSDPTDWANTKPDAIRMYICERLLMSTRAAILDTKLDKETLLP